MITKAHKTSQKNNHTPCKPQEDPSRRPLCAPSVWRTWWSWRGCPTRSHPELGRETPQRRWYCVLRRGRVGRRQVLQAERKRQRKRQKQPKKTTKTPFCHTPMPKPHHHTTNARAPLKRGTPNPTAGWSSPVARQAHNLKVAGSNPAPATKLLYNIKCLSAALRGGVACPIAMSTLCQQNLRSVGKRGVQRVKR
jgi:hypothetical protein